MPKEISSEAIWHQWPTRLKKVRHDLDDLLPKAKELIPKDNVRETFEGAVLDRLSGEKFDYGLDWDSLKSGVRREFSTRIGSWKNTSVARILDSTEFLLNRITADCVDEVISHGRNLRDLTACVDYIEQNEGRLNMAELSIGTLLHLHRFQTNELERSREGKPTEERVHERLEKLPVLMLANIFPSELIKKYEMQIVDDPGSEIKIGFESEQYGLRMVLTAPYSANRLQVACDLKKPGKIDPNAVKMFALNRASDIATITGRELIFNGERIDIDPNEQLTLHELNGTVAEYARIMRETHVEREWYDKVGVDNIENDAQIDEHVGSGKLVKLLSEAEEEEEERRQSVTIKRGKYFEVISEKPYVTPEMKNIWDTIVTTYADRLTVREIEPSEGRLRVTSAVRSQQRQAELIAEGYPAAISSSHTRGEAIDVYFSWLEKNQPEHARTLMEILTQMKQLGTINVVVEHQKMGNVLHIARNPLK